jgi:hypothetical protein
MSERRDKELPESHQTHMVKKKSHRTSDHQKEMAGNPMFYQQQWVVTGMVPGQASHLSQARFDHRQQQHAQVQLQMQLQHLAALQRQQANLHAAAQHLSAEQPVHEERQQQSSLEPPVRQERQRRKRMSARQQAIPVAAAPAVVVANTVPEGAPEGAQSAPEVALSVAKVKLKKQLKRKGGKKKAAKLEMSYAHALAILGYVNFWNIYH